jgi:hypothetical protein
MRRPTFPEISAVIGICGTLLAIFSYFANNRERIPSFLIDPSRATIVDANTDAGGDLTVTYHGKQVTHASVNLVRIYFWNAGREEIRSTDVLRPFRVSLPTDSTILDARILRSSRSLSNFQLLQSPSDPNSVQLSFDIAEHNDGATLQLIYVGGRDAKLSFSGVVVGSNEPIIRVPTPEPSTEDISASDRIASRALAWVTLVLIFFIIALIVLGWHKRGSDLFLVGDKSVLPVPIILLPVSVIIALIFVYIELHPLSSVPSALIGH